MTPVRLARCLIQRLAADFALTQDGSERQPLQHMCLLHCLTQMGFALCMVHMMLALQMAVKLAMGLTQSLAVELNGFQPLVVALAKCHHRIAVNLALLAMG